MFINTCCRIKNFKFVIKSNHRITEVINQASLQTKSSTEYPIESDNYTDTDTESLLIQEIFQSSSESTENVFLKSVREKYQDIITLNERVNSGEIFEDLDSPKIETPPDNENDIITSQHLNLTENVEEEEDDQLKQDHWANMSEDVTKALRQFGLSELIGKIEHPAPKDDLTSNAQFISPNQTLSEETICLDVSNNDTNMSSDIPAVDPETWKDDPDLSPLKIGGSLLTRLLNSFVGMYPGGERSTPSDIQSSTNEPLRATADGDSR